MHGAIDIIYEQSNFKILESILKNINYIKCKNKDATIYCLACLNVNGRMDRDNYRINELNSYLKENLGKKAKWINADGLNNKYGKLELSYTLDGLHLNRKGYARLKKILEDYLKEQEKEVAKNEFHKNRR